MKNFIALTLFFIMNTLCGQSFSEYEEKFKFFDFETTFLFENIDSRLAVLDNDQEHIFGIDFSHYTGTINWNIVGNDTTATRPGFIIMRSTMGEDGVDTHYRENLVKALEHNFLIGFYHYFRAHEKGKAQAYHYLKNSFFDCFNVLPIIDIEYKRKSLPADIMRRELLECLHVVEDHLGVKPLIYTNLNFYKEHLKDYPEFAEYPLWIAAYSEKRKEEVMEFAHMYQYTDKHIMPGIQYPVDANIISKNNIKKILLGLD